RPATGLWRQAEKDSYKITELCISATQGPAPPGEIYPETERVSEGSVDVDVIAFGLEFEIGERTSARSSFTDVAGRTAGASTGSF
ncbi:hypothetical protein, partial [uncultured Boseongicola sp.]|uniref:hypothetical protein n=1 Tax=uncultured Boseongicola sp. TaxID=1648499 RepID=UPI0026157AA5